MQLKLNKAKPLSSRTYADFVINRPANLDAEISGEFCSMWSTLDRNVHTKTNRKSTARYKQHFDKMNKRGVDFTNGLTIEKIPKNKPKKDLYLKVCELKVNNGKPKLLVLYFSETETNCDNPIDLIWHQNHYCSTSK